MNLDEFLKELEIIGIKLSEKQINDLIKYKNFLIEYNKHTNLTRIVDENDIYLKHFYDSLTIIKYIKINEYKTILDIGTGAGFPGMVLKIVYPNLSVTLLDSNNKKIAFLKELIKLLNISVNLVNNRAEEYIKDKRECFDIVVSRAVSFLPVLLELTIPFVKINGYFIAMKGDATNELQLSKNTANILGASIKSINNFKLIKEDSIRTIIIYEKNERTKLIYPRSYSKIVKNYLK
ncbi:MAG: 16S rRNA (guanine(527)-N(7))-methyltransferase RsmG [Bacilli bacterium]|nr:16S rRNA (guanine(527)-N(7))-methyltransferase RsmG [Bacilli bacterium]